MVSDGEPGWLPRAGMGSAGPRAAVRFGSGEPGKVSVSANLGRSRMRAKRRKKGSGPSVLIVGGGFAGLSAMQALAGSGASVTLVDRNIYSTFQPLLYQVATAGLTSADVAYPLWAATGKSGARFRKGELARLDLVHRLATLTSGEDLSYDYLIIATGVSAA